MAAYLEAHRDHRDSDGRALVVRNGKGRTQNVTIGSGTITVRAPRVNERGVEANGERRRFTSRILLQGLAAESSTRQSPAIARSADHFPEPLIISATHIAIISRKYSKPSPACLPDQFMKNPLGR